jgi:hypothetical protein
MKSLKHGEGYLLIDNRGNDGVPDELVHAAGLPVGAGRGMFEADTIHCVHCGTCFLKKPDRVRPRGHCRVCDKYICDPCEGATRAAGYVHRTFEDLATLLQSGRYQLAGTVSAPILIPIDCTPNFL